MFDDDIAAISTAPGRSALAVVRVSGQGIEAIAERIGLEDLEPRHATVRHPPGTGVRWTAAS